MANIIYKYIFNDGSVYIGSDSVNKYKRALDHYAEAWYLLDPINHNAYYTSFPQAAGNLFSPNDFRTTSGVYNIQRMSERWARLVTNQRRNREIQKNKSEKQETQEQIDRRKRLKVSIDALFDTKNDDIISDFLKEKNIKKDTIDPLLKETLTGWYYWDCSGFIKELKQPIQVDQERPKQNLAINIKKQQVDADGKIIKGVEPIKEQIQIQNLELSYLSFLQYYIKGSDLHIVEALTAAHELKNGNIKQAGILNEKIGDVELDANIRKWVMHKNNSTNIVEILTAPEYKRKLSQIIRSSAITKKETGFTKKSLTAALNVNEKGYKTTIKYTLEGDIQKEGFRDNIQNQIVNMMHINWQGDKAAMFNYIAKRMPIVTKNEDIINDFNKYIENRRK